MTTNHIYFCFSPHFWLRINLDCLLNGDYINFNSGFSRMKSRSSRTTLWCLIVIIRKCFVSRCPNMYTARYGKTVRAWLERAALRLSNALARARAQAKKPNAALTANRDARARAEPRQITCVKIVDLLSNITMLWNLNKKLKFRSKSMSIWTQLNSKRFTKPLINLSRNLPMSH